MREQFSKECTATDDRVVINFSSIICFEALHEVHVAHLLSLVHPVAKAKLEFVWPADWAPLLVLSNFSFLYRKLDTCNDFLRENH